MEAEKEFAGQQEKETVILFTGDSLTDGGRMKRKDQEWDLNHQMGHCYAYIVNGLIGSQYPEKNFHFRNKGNAGDRILDLYARNERDLYPIRPDILSVLVGVNDGFSGNNNNDRPTPQKKFETLYRLFLEEIREEMPDTKLILMEPFVCKAGRIRGEYDAWRECVTGYAATVRKLSEEFGTVFVPLQEEFDKRTEAMRAEYWSWDGVHPTENGHGLIAMQWIKAAKGLLGI